MFEVATAPCRDDAEIEAMTAGLAREERGGLLVLPENFNIVHRDAIITLAARYRLPAVYPYRFFTDRILKGAKPADFPVQNPDKFEDRAGAQHHREAIAPCHCRRGDRISNRCFWRALIFAPLRMTAQLCLGVNRSFDHLVGNLENMEWNGEAEHLGGLEIDDQRVFRRLLNRKVGRTGALEDAVYVGCRL